MRWANLAVLMLFAAAVNAADLTIKVTDINSDKGYILIAVDDSVADFDASRGDVAGIQYRSAPGESSVTLSGISEGRYAVSVMHDENGNGELDMRGQIPLEGYGFSGTGSPYRQPKFNSAAIDVKKPASTITVKMIYLN